MYKLMQSEPRPTSQRYLPRNPRGGVLCGFPFSALPSRRRSRWASRRSCFRKWKDGNPSA